MPDKNFFSRLFLLLAVAAGASWSCDTKNPVPPGGNIRIEFDNVVGDKNLVLNGVSYENATGEDFIVTRFNYYVSNFKLYKTDGTVFTVPQDSCYFLIKEDNTASQLVTLKNIPAGDYDHVEFMVGVDSLRNTMPEARRTGALDPGGDMAGEGMYWAWNSGYVFVKLEGRSSFGNPTNNKFYYHIGLYGGYDKPTVNNTRIVKLKFGDDIAKVTTSHTPEVHLFADVLRFFDGPATHLSIAQYPGIMAADIHRPYTQKLADNYQKMFSYDHTH